MSEINSELTKDVYLVVEGNHEETISLGSKNTISGTWTGIKHSDPTRVLSTYIKLDNTAPIYFSVSKLAINIIKPTIP